MPKSTFVLKATVTRRPAADPVDQAERQGQRTDLLPVTELRVNLPEVTKGKTAEIAAEKAGFGSEKTYRDAKTVVTQGTPELVAADPVDQAERQLQAEHHQAAENASQAAVEAATAVEPETRGKDLKREAHVLQAAFLAGNLGKPVAVFTINGRCLTGKLRQFDQFTLLLEGPDGLISLVFKSAVTTIAPAC